MVQESLLNYARVTCSLEGRRCASNVLPLVCVFGRCHAKIGDLFYPWFRRLSSLDDVEDIVQRGESPEPCAGDLFDGAHPDLFYMDGTTRERQGRSCAEPRSPSRSLVLSREDSSYFHLRLPRYERASELEGRRCTSNVLSTCLFVCVVVVTLVFSRFTRGGLDYTLGIGPEAHSQVYSLILHARVNCFSHEGPRGIALGLPVGQT